MSGLLKGFNDRKSIAWVLGKMEEGNMRGGAGSVGVDSGACRRCKMGVCSSRSGALGIDLAVPREHNLWR